MTNDHKQIAPKFNGAKKLKFPEDLKYTRTHEWVKIEGNILTIGITSCAVKMLQGINHIIMNEPIKLGAERIFWGAGLEIEPLTQDDLADEKVREGTKYIPGKVVTIIEPGKDNVMVYAPIKGKIIEFNPKVNEKKFLEDGTVVLLIEIDPYGEDGWITKIEITDYNSLIPLLSAKEYEKIVEQWND